ncbi:MAG: hypothetical protein ACOVLE_03765, partial [Pirellula staleyi]
GKPLDGFDDLLMMTSPDSDEAMASSESASSTVGSEDEEMEPRGLHAKVIVAEHDLGITMWVGSANATGRGWKGPNAEVIARTEITREVAEGLTAFINQSATTMKPNELLETLEIDEPQERLDKARTQVSAAWHVSQKMDATTPVLTADSDPNPLDAEIQLEVASLNGPWTVWRRGDKILRLSVVSESDVTELLLCRLSLEDRETVWMQIARMDPSPGIERDRKALARYLDPRTFLQWLRSILVGISPGDGGGSWGGSGTKTDRVGPHGPAWWSPTLEEILKAWGRDPSSLHEVDRKAQYYLELHRQRDPSEITDEEKRIVTDFEGVWSILRTEMVTKR